MNHIHKKLYNFDHRTSIKYVWIQGHVINASRNEDVLEVSDEPKVANIKNVESVIIIDSDKVIIGKCHLVQQIVTQ